MNVTQCIVTFLQDYREGSDLQETVVKVPGGPGTDGAEPAAQGLPPKEGVGLTLSVFFKILTSIHFNTLLCSSSCLLSS